MRSLRTHNKLFHIYIVSHFFDVYSVWQHLHSVVLLLHSVILYYRFCYSRYRICCEHKTAALAAWNDKGSCFHCVYRLYVIIAFQRIQIFEKIFRSHGEIEFEKFQKKSENRNRNFGIFKNLDFSKFSKFQISGIFIFFKFTNFTFSKFSDERFPKVSRFWISKL